MPVQLNHNYRTDDEYYFSCYLDELGEANLINSYSYEPFSIVITQGLKNPYTDRKELKTKIKYENKEQIILERSEYTPDFIIDFDKSASQSFFNLLDSGAKMNAPFIAQKNGESNNCLIECKPDFDSNNMTRLFVINQKIIWDKYKMFVNLAENKSLFSKTFTPQAYLKTPTGRDKKINFKTKTLKQYLNEKTF